MPHNRNSRHVKSRNAKMIKASPTKLLFSKFRRSRLGESRCLTTGLPNCRNAEMQNTFWLILWSQPLVTSTEDGGRSQCNQAQFWSFRDQYVKRKETLTTGILKCRNAKQRIKRKTLQTPSNGAGELEYDRRATVALHSVTTRNN
jgi:hypothetical protein